MGKRKRRTHGKREGMSNLGNVIIVVEGGGSVCQKEKVGKEEQGGEGGFNKP